MPNRNRRFWNLLFLGVASISLYNCITLLGNVSISTIHEERYVLSSFDLNPTAMRLTVGGKTAESNMRLTSIRRDSETIQKKTRNTTTGPGIAGFRFLPSKNNNAVVKNIVLIGERHSGTTFFTKYLQDCFPSVHITDTFVTGKHWMQPPPQHVIRVAKSYGKEALKAQGLGSWWDIAQTLKAGGHPFQTSLVISMFRDPFDWVEAMRRKPHHWPNHVDFFPDVPSMSNQSFRIVTQELPKESIRSINGAVVSTTSKKELSSTEGKNVGVRFDGPVSIQKSLVRHRLLNWTTFVMEQNLYVPEYHHHTAQNSNRDIICQKGFAQNTVSPCQRNTTYVPQGLNDVPSPFLRHLFASANDPVYEKNSNGKPFENILQLRAKKIDNFLRIPQVWETAGSVVVPYERLLEKDVRQRFIKTISNVLRVTNSCPQVPIYDGKRYDIPQDFREWIINNADWKLECMIGYNY